MMHLMSSSGVGARERIARRSSWPYRWPRPGWGLQTSPSERCRCPLPRSRSGCSHPEACSGSGPWHSTRSCPAPCSGTLERRQYAGCESSPHPDSVRERQLDDDAGNQRSTQDRNGAKADPDAAGSRHRTGDAAACLPVVPRGSHPGHPPCHTAVTARREDGIELGQGGATPRGRTDLPHPSRAFESPGSMTTQQPAARAARCSSRDRWESQP